MGLWVKQLHFVSIVEYLQSTPFAPSLLGRSSLMWGCPTPGSGSNGPRQFFPLRGYLRFLSFSFPARSLRSLREVCQLHLSVTSLTVTGFSIFRRLVTSTLHNEIETSSLIILRLAGSLPRSSPRGLFLSMPNWLHVGHLFDVIITF